MLETIALINSYTQSVNAVEPSLMNFCVTDGVSVSCISSCLSIDSSSKLTWNWLGSQVVATRYISSSTEEAASLFFSTGSSFEEYEPGGYKMTKTDGKREHILLIASEPLTFERADWLEIPSQTCLVITPKVSSSSFFWSQRPGLIRVRFRSATCSSTRSSTRTFCRRRCRSPGRTTSQRQKVTGTHWETCFVFSFAHVADSVVTSLPGGRPLRTSLPPLRDRLPFALPNATRLDSVSVAYTLVVPPCNPIP